MNRICLKRKEASRKPSLCTLADSNANENIQIEKQDGLSQISNSPVVIKQPQQESSSNQRMFEQFKVQYDQLRNVYETQRVAYDDLLQQKKRLEIQILNNNHQFYEKQIKRLRAEVEKLQEENEDNKHKYIMAQNTKKQLEATVKVRNEQLKRSIQLIEKEKVSCVELKHQLTQKEKLFQRITSEMQKSSNVLSQSFQDTNARVQKLQSSLKTKTSDLEALQRNYDHLAKKLAETQRAMKTNKQIFDQTNFKKTQMIDELQTKLRSLNRSSRDTIQGLEVKLQEAKNKRKTENLWIDQQIESKQNFKQQRITELEIVRLEENNKQIKIDLENKCKLVKSLEEKLLNTYTREEYQELQKKYKDLDSQKADTCKQYQQKLLKANKQIETLKLSQFRNPGVEGGVRNDFQQLLRVQLEQNAKIKRQLSFKIDQVYNLKADIDDLKCKMRVNQDQIMILNKKIKSQEKNHKIQADVSNQNLKNEIDSLRRKVDMLQNKVDQKTKQIKEKQSFIMNTIIGRSRQQDVPLIIAEMQRIFEADYATRLNAALQKIEELQKK